MKASLPMFESIAALVEKGLSPSRAGMALKLSPDTISRWRREHPEFTTLLESAESLFIQRMTDTIATAAPKDWRAAEALLARRFPMEFARDSAAVQISQTINHAASTPESQEALRQRVMNSPAMQRAARRILDEGKPSAKAPANSEA